MASVTGFLHGRRFLEAMSIKQAAFGDFRPCDVAAAARGVAVVTVEFPSCGQQGIAHLVWLGDGADDISL